MEPEKSPLQNEVQTRESELTQKHVWSQEVEYLSQPSSSNFSAFLNTVSFMSSRYLASL